MRDDITLQLAKIWYVILVWKRVIRHTLLPDSQTPNLLPKIRVGAGVIYVKHSGRPVPTQETKCVWAKFSQVSTSASYVSREHALCSKDVLFSFGPQIFCVFPHYLWGLIPDEVLNVLHVSKRMLTAGSAAPSPGTQVAMDVFLFQ